MNLAPNVAVRITLLSLMMDMLIVLDATISINQQKKTNQDL